MKRKPVMVMLTTGQICIYTPVDNPLPTSTGSVLSDGITAQNPYVLGMHPSGSPTLMPLIPGYTKGDQFSAMLNPASILAELEVSDRHVPMMDAYRDATSVIDLVSGSNNVHAFVKP